MKKTAEFVSPKHPDKICDLISDNILTKYLQKDPTSRVAIETLGGKKAINIVGEVTSDANIDIREAVREVYNEDVSINIDISKQSSEIAQGVDEGGAGDQGIMVGYACNETFNLMPLEYELARNLATFLFNKYPEDGKTQITINEDKEIDTIVCSWSNTKKEQLLEDVTKWVSLNKPADNIKIKINPAGDWKKCGFEADAGLTGRKIVVDSYGPRVPVGGGAFSGKDPSKVDRSGAYMARKVACDLLLEKEAEEVLVKIAYGIGIKEPVMAKAEIDGKLVDLRNYNLDYKSIIKDLDLLNTNYYEVAKWGHFGRDFKWDRIKNSTV